VPALPTMCSLGISYARPRAKATDGERFIVSPVPVDPATTRGMLCCRDRRGHPGWSARKLPRSGPAQSWPCSNSWSCCHRAPGPAFSGCPRMPTQPLRVWGLTAWSWVNSFWAVAGFSNPFSPRASFETADRRAARDYHGPWNSGRG